MDDDNVKHLAMARWWCCAALVVLSLCAAARVTARIPATKFDMKQSSSVRTDKKKQKATNSPLRSVKDTFFDSVDDHNKEAAAMLSELFSATSGWDYVNIKDGVKVEKRTLPAGSFVDASDAEKGSKHACVKSTGIIKAPLEAVFELFTDNTRVSEYNEHCKVIKDVHQFPKLIRSPFAGNMGGSGDSGGGVDGNSGGSTKITWASSPKYGPFKARDFVSVVNYRRFKNGTAVILNRPAYHPKYPPSKNFVRATVLLAGNVLEPHGPDGQHCKVTQIAHVNPGGGADTAAMAWVINKLCSVGPPTFIRNLERAAQKTASARAAAGGVKKGERRHPFRLGGNGSTLPGWFGVDVANKTPAPLIVAWGKKAAGHLFGQGDDMR